MDAPESHPASLVAGLSDARFQGYLFQPIPSDLDNQVRALVLAYQALDRDERSSLQALLIGEPVDILESFAERQAVFAVRSGSIEPVRLGLAALGMSFPRGDSAQAVMALAKLDHSARLLGADLADVAFDALAVLPEEFRYFTAKFLAREDRGGSLLTKLGFAAYGSGPDFVYDNAVPGAAPTTAPAPVPRESGFVARQRYTSTIPGDLVAMRVKDGALVVTDERGRRSVFPLSGAGAPAAVVRAFEGTHRWWVVTDREGQAVVSGADDDWSRDAFAGVAEVAGLPFDLEALAPGYAVPAPRPDHVDLSRSKGSGCLSIAAFIVGALLAVYALIGLWAGFPWLWAVLWGLVGTWWNTKDYRNKAVYDRNLAALPADERPLTPHREIKLAKAMLGLAVFALGPPALAYLIRGAGPLP